VCKFAGQFYHQVYSIEDKITICVRTNSGRGLLSKMRTGVDRERDGGDKNWQKCADILYG